SGVVAIPGRDRGNMDACVIPLRADQATEPLAFMPRVDPRKIHYDSATGKRIGNRGDWEPSSAPGQNPRALFPRVGAETHDGRARFDDSPEEQPAFDERLRPGEELHPVLARLLEAQL